MFYCLLLAELSSELKWAGRFSFKVKLLGLVFGLQAQAAGIGLWFRES